MKAITTITAYMNIDIYTGMTVTDCVTIPIVLCVVFNSNSPPIMASDTSFFASEPCTSMDRQLKAIREFFRIDHREKPDRSKTVRTRDDMGDVVHLS